MWHTGNFALLAISYNICSVVVYACALFIGGVLVQMIDINSSDCFKVIAWVLSVPTVNVYHVYS